MVRKYCEEIDLLRLGQRKARAEYGPIAEALGRETAQGLTVRTGSITSGLLVIRPESMASAEITFYKPTSQD